MIYVTRREVTTKGMCWVGDGTPCGLAVVGFAVPARVMRTCTFFAHPAFGVCC